MEYNLLVFMNYGGKAKWFLFSPNKRIQMNMTKNEREVNKTCQCQVHFSYELLESVYKIHSLTHHILILNQMWQGYAWQLKPESSNLFIVYKNDVQQYIDNNRKI